MQPLDENPSRSEAFFRESIRLASETLIEAETKHKTFVYSLNEKHQQESEKLQDEISSLKEQINLPTQTLMETIQEQKTRIAYLNEQLERERTTLVSEIVALRQSRSWRLTRPLRIVYVIFTKRR